MPAQTVIKIRRDDSTNWSTIDPVLSAGEIGFDTSAQKFKVGDGTSLWSELVYASDPESVVAELQTYANDAAASAASAAQAAAISSANSYSDSLAENYDPAGSAASALSSAQTYADGVASGAVTIHNDDTTSVHGIADTSVLLTTAGGTLTGYLTLHADPTQALHAATKEYVDNVATGIIAKPAVKAATTANLTANYDNGTLGVGATLTATTNGAFPLIDGEQLTTVNGDKGLLVKNQSSALQNGRYNLTTQGDTETPWVLTRCSFCDTADEIPGMYVFVQEGTVNKGKGFVALVTDVDTFTVGTDPIYYTQFSGAGTYVAGNGIELIDNAFAIDETIVATLTDLSAKQNVVSGVSDTEIGYLDGVTSAIQTQINLKAPLESPAFTGTVTGMPSVPTVANSAANVGFMGIPQVTTATGITLGLIHAGKHIYTTATGQTHTIPASTTTNFEIGTTFVVINTGAATTNINIAGTDTLVLANTAGTVGQRTLAPNGMATIVKLEATRWIISGNGLT